MLEMALEGSEASKSGEPQPNGAAKLRQAFHKLCERELVRVGISRHAFERLLERRAREYKKLSREVLEGIIANTIRDGKCRILGESVKIVSKSYTLGCTVEDGMLIVRTVMRTRREDLNSVRGARNAPWRRIVVVKAPRRLKALEREVG